MAMAAKRKFIVRVQSSQGVFRATFDSDRATFGDLKMQITLKYFVPPDEQILSYDPPTTPRFLEADESDALSGSQLKLSHGQRIFLVLGKNHLEEIAVRKRAAEATEEKSATGTVSISRDGVLSSKSSSGSSKLPTAAIKRKGPLSMSLTSASFRAKIESEAALEKKGPKHVPFAAWIAARQKRMASTPWMIDPPTHDYRAVKRTASMRFSDLPANAVIKRQEYRHCDVVRVQDTAPLRKFKMDWEKESSVQRGAYLIGKVTEGPSLRPEADGGDSAKMVYADVYALYVPPQRGSRSGVKLLKDAKASLVDTLLAACGLQRVGWLVTTLPRGGKAYKGDIFMSGAEIVTAARLQHTHRNANTGFSQFGTLVLHISTKLPEAYMISDQGVAMIRGALVGAVEDPGFLGVREAPAGSILPSVISEMAEVKTGHSFLPDALLVNLISTQPKKQKPMFKFAHFPPNGNVEKLNDHMTYHRETPRHRALSDFNLLAFMAKVMDIELVCELATYVVSEKVIPDALDNRFRAQMRALTPV